MSRQEVWIHASQVTPQRDTRGVHELEYAVGQCDALERVALEPATGARDPVAQIGHHIAFRDVVEPAGPQQRLALRVRISEHRQCRYPDAGHADGVAVVPGRGVDGPCRHGHTLEQASRQILGGQQDVFRQVPPERFVPRVVAEIVGQRNAQQPWRVLDVVAVGQHRLVDRFLHQHGPCFGRVGFVAGQLIDGTPSWQPSMTRGDP